MASGSISSTAASSQPIRFSNAFVIPNSVFCEPGQGQNEASLARNPRTLLYLSAAYNYAAGWSEGFAPAGGEPGLGPRETKSLGLYTLGRSSSSRSPSSKSSKPTPTSARRSTARTSASATACITHPEWVVERIVAETVGGRLADLKAECGWPAAGSDRLPDDAALNRFDTGLRETLYSLIRPAGPGPS